MPLTPPTAAGASTDDAHLMHKDALQAFHRLFGQIGIDPDTAALPEGAVEFGFFDRHACKSSPLAAFARLTLPRQPGTIMVINARVGSLVFGKSTVAIGNQPIERPAEMPSAQHGD